MGVGLQPWERGREGVVLPERRDGAEHTALHSSSFTAVAALGASGSFPPTDIPPTDTVRTPTLIIVEATR